MVPRDGLQMMRARVKPGVTHALQSHRGGLEATLVSFWMCVWWGGGRGEERAWRKAMILVWTCFLEEADLEQAHGDG